MYHIDTLMYGGGFWLDLGIKVLFTSLFVTWWCNPLALFGKLLLSMSSIVWRWPYPVMTYNSKSKIMFAHASQTHKLSVYWFKTFRTEISVCVLLRIMNSLFYIVLIWGMFSCHISCSQLQKQMLVCRIPARAGTLQLFNIVFMMLLSLIWTACCYLKNFPQHHYQMCVVNVQSLFAVSLFEHLLYMCDMFFQILLKKEKKL